MEVSVVPFREVWTNPTTHTSIGLIGAGRGRLLRGRLIESLVVAALPGAAGLALAALSVEGIRAFWPDRLMTGTGGEVGNVYIDRQYSGDQEISGCSLKTTCR